MHTSGSDMISFSQNTLTSYRATTAGSGTEPRARDFYSAAKYVTKRNFFVYTSLGLIQWWFIHTRSQHYCWCCFARPEAKCLYTAQWVRLLFSLFSSNGKVYKSLQNWITTISYCFADRCIVKICLEGISMCIAS